MIEYERTDISEVLMLLKQIGQKNVCFAIIGIF